MRKYIIYLCLIFAASVTLVYGAELKVPKLTGRVVDNARLLSTAEKSKVESTIMQFENATKGQMAVLIIPSLDGDALEPFSMRVAEKWKIGYKGKDNGILLLISVNDHKIRFEVGYGYEGNINDARAGDIIRDMGPYFRARRFGDGITFAVIRAQEMITGKTAATAPPAISHSGKSGGGDIFFRILMLVVVFIIIFNISHRSGGSFLIYSGGYRGGYRGGGFGGGGFGGGGFSGGGGGFGGGGASGGW